ncbi:MAG: 50S ribosomal protein L15 [Sedimentisphaerales bacterium]|nr:50S ribosomal protein L15 [Sedimentisphaerales bacterium]
MLNHEITSKAGRKKTRKRLGRGTGSGQGKTSGRGHKGAGSRAGARAFSLYEGGQMPLFRRLPKRGFSNFNFAERCQIVNVSQLERFDDGADVGVEQLSGAGLIGSLKGKVKILGDGVLTKRLKVVAHKFSKTAEEKIVASGGTARVI